jgi:Acetyltransferase (GNAT) family
VELSDAIRHVVLFPESDQPGFPSGHPSRRFEVEGVLVVLPGGLPLGLVKPERIEESEVEHVVDSVRRLHRAEQRERALWFVPEAASPAGLAQRLLTLGMRPNDFPGADARSAQMVCLAAPPPGPPGVVARPAATFDEFLQARLVLADSIGLDEATRETVMREAEHYWPFQSQPGAVDTFVALVDGEVVAYGGARFGRSAVYLAGGGTRPEHRGRGAYGALVRARWDAAVERGTPLLTVGAGEMSRPILERLDFSIVGWEDCLLDPLD